MKKLKIKTLKIRLIALVIAQILFVSNVSFADISRQEADAAIFTLSPKIVVGNIVDRIMLRARVLEANIDTDSIKNIKFQLEQVKNKKGVLKEEELQAIFSNRKNVVGRLAAAIEKGKKSHEDITLILYVIVDNMKTLDNLPLFIATELRRNEPIKQRRKQGKLAGPDFESLKIIYDFFKFAVMFEECHELLEIRTEIINKLHAYIDLHLTANIKNLDELVNKFDELYFSWQDEVKVIEVFNNKLLDLILQWGKFTSHAEKMFYQEESRLSINKARSRRYYVKSRDNNLREALKAIYCVFPSTNLLKMFLYRLQNKNIEGESLEEWLKEFDWKMLEVLMDIFYWRELENGQKYQWQSDFKDELFSLFEQEKLRTTIVLLKIATTSENKDIENRLMHLWDDYKIIERILEVFRKRITNENAVNSFSRRRERILNKIVLREDWARQEAEKKENVVLENISPVSSVSKDSNVIGQKEQTGENIRPVLRATVSKLTYSEKLKQAVDIFVKDCVQNERLDVIDLFSFDFDKFIWGKNKCDAAIIPAKLTDDQIIQVLQHTKVNGIIWILNGRTTNNQKHKDRVVTLGADLGMRINKTRNHGFSGIICTVRKQRVLEDDKDEIIEMTEITLDVQSLDTQNAQDNPGNATIIRKKSKDEVGMKFALRRWVSDVVRKNPIVSKILNTINAVSIGKQKLGLENRIEQAI